MSDSELELSNIPAPPPLPPSPTTVTPLRASRSQEDVSIPTKPTARTSQSDTTHPVYQSGTAKVQFQDEPKIEPAEAAAAAIEPEPQTYRTELVIPIGQHDSSVPEAKENTPVPGSSCGTNATIPINEHAQREELPHADMKHLLQYFEQEIKKETEGAEKDRIEYDDLMKYKNVRRWSTSRGSSAYATAQPLKPRSTSIERTSSIPKSYGTVVLKTTALSKTRLSEEEHGAQNTELIHGVLDQTDFQKQLAAAGSKLVIVDFYANWCGPCSIIAPKVDLLAVQHQGRVVFLKVDIELCTSKELLKEFEITSLPSFVFIKNSKKVDAFSGATTAEGTLKALIAKYS